MVVLRPGFFASSSSAFQAPGAPVAPVHRQVGMSFLGLSWVFLGLGVIVDGYEGMRVCMMGGGGCKRVMVMCDRCWVMLRI